MIQLQPDECRVLGVLVEKAQTTPAQYPLTLNGLVVGCNQKNNRDPVTNLDEDRVLDAIDGLRKKELVREAMLSGSRVSKFRHVAREALEVSTAELVILTELLLRGPQSAGELRSRASRMHPLESLDAVQNVIQSLMDRPEPLLRQLAPAPGERAVRFGQLLCPDLHPIGAGSAGEASSARAAARSVSTSPELTARVEELERQVAALTSTVHRLAASLGESVG